MNEWTMENCRLCNYQSDQRLMLNIFEEQSGYAEKIDNYLGLKVYPDDKTPSFICFHCSQTLDNFHNFATKIKAIQKIIFPNQIHIQEISYEITVIDNDLSEDSGVKGEATKRQPIEIEISSDPAIDPEIQQEEITIPHPSESSHEEDLSSIDFESKLLHNGVLKSKGEELMLRMSQFYCTSCELCSVNLKNINELFDHQKSSHSIEPYVTCCAKKLTRMPSIIWHFVRHIEPESFKCHICSYSVSRPKHLKRHLQNHSDPSLKQFSCDKCDKKFIWKGALKSHLMNHQPESERKNFSCTICKRKYQSAGSLSWHKKVAHSSSGPVKSKNLCEICSKTFATSTSFKEHMLIHSEDSEKLQLRCEKCGKWLKNQRCLKSHMLLHTDVEYFCSLCSYTTKKLLLLKNHTITRHTSDRPWSCDECDKTFKVKRALTVHKSQSHSGAKVGRTCEFCDKTFGSSTNYYTHRKNLHADDLKKSLAERDAEKKLKRIEMGLEGPS